jgi:plasmanylethanolamine desaturase
MVILSIFALKIIGLTLFADFLTGVVHFWMDQYGREEMPFVGKHVIEINILHHSNPRNMIKKSYWQLTWTSWLLGGLILIPLYWFGYGSWEGIFVVAMSANANIIHKWTHQTTKENMTWVNWLQKLKVIQSRKHHAGHHIAPFDRHFCILTNLLNPILTRLKFWESIVWVFKKMGIPPVAGSQIRQFV